LLQKVNEFRALQRALSSAHQAFAPDVCGRCRSIRSLLSGQLPPGKCTRNLRNLADPPDMVADRSSPRRTPHVSLRPLLCHRGRWLPAWSIYKNGRGCLAVIASYRLWKAPDAASYHRSRSRFRAPQKGIHRPRVLEPPAQPPVMLGRERRQNNVVVLLVNHGACSSADFDPCAATPDLNPTFYGRHNGLGFRFPFTPPYPTVR